MLDFTFHNPTEIIFGAGKEALIGAELKAAGIKKVLLVYGRNSVVKSGLLDRVMAWPMIYCGRLFQTVLSAGIPLKNILPNLAGFARSPHRQKNTQYMSFLSQKASPIAAHINQFSPSV